MAVALGMDLGAAAQLLTKSIASQTNALARYGIEINGAAGSNDRLVSALDQVQKRFGGQAAAEIDTYTGQLNQLSKAWDELLESVGKVVVKSGVLQGSFKFMTDMIGGHHAPALAKLKHNLNDYNNIQQTNIITIDETAEAYKEFKKVQDAKAAADKQSAEFLSRYNAELMKQSGLLAQTERFTKNQNLSASKIGRMEPTDKKLKEVELLTQDLDKLQSTAYQTADEIENKYNTLAGQITETIGEPLARYFTDAEYSMTDFFEEMRRQIIKTMILEAIKAIVSAILSKYGAAGSAGSSIFGFFLDKYANAGESGSTGGGFESGGSMAPTMPSGSTSTSMPALGSTSVPNGRPIVVNITGNVMSKTYVIDEIIPQIKQAVRMGRA
jgi:hypothetical protein